jgi:N6-L-threonylcarbamoyladenine synthase
MRTLAIETSCDDTSLAVLNNEFGFFVVEKIMAYTQTEEHKKRWGVVPELAARAHADKIVTVLESLHIDRSTIDTISVTAFPGLPGALVVWVTTAYTLWALYNKPVIEVHHIMWHIFSVLVERSLADIQFPYVCLTVSGGHNDLYVVNSHQSSVISDQKLMSNEWWLINKSKLNHVNIWESIIVWPYSVTKLWQTIDDASWECFDKVARMLWWPYPWGKWIGDQAIQYDLWSHTEHTWSFNAAKLPDQPFNFSFSGIKWQIHQLVSRGEIDPKNANDIHAVAYHFQEAVTDVLVEKLAKAVQKFWAKTVGVVWWVSANLRLREKIAIHPLLSKANVLFPTQFVYCTDNAAMIGVVGLMEEDAV